MSRNLENATSLYNNDLLVDSLFTNLAYLEPRHFLNARKIVDKTIVSYFKKSQIKINDQNFNEEIEKIISELRNTKEIKEAKASLVDGYYILLNKENEMESDRLGFADVNSSIRKKVIISILKTAETDKALSKKNISKLYKQIDKIPQNKFEEMLDSEHKKESYSLMSTLMEVVQGVKIDDLSNPTRLVGSTEITCKQSNGWFDIGNADSKQGFFECSFFAGYIANEVPKTLHIGIRGTEGNEMSVGKYALKDYPNMTRHYKRLRPFINQLIEQECAKNKELNIAFSGHSLGAAMTELALLEHKDKFSEGSSVKFTGLAVANPGGIHAAKKLMDELDIKEEDLINKRRQETSENNGFMNSLSYTSYALKRSSVFYKKCLAFLSVGAISSALNILTCVNKVRDNKRLGPYATNIKNTYNFIFKNKVCECLLIADIVNVIEGFSRNVVSITQPHFSEAIEKARDFMLGPPIEDPRLVSIIHEQDVVGKVGSTTAVQKRDNKIILTAVNCLFEKINEFVKLKSTLYHDNNNYVSAIKDLTDKESVCKRINDIVTSRRDRVIPSFNVKKI